MSLNTPSRKCKVSIPNLFLQKKKGNSKLLDCALSEWGKYLLPASLEVHYYFHSYDGKTQEVNSEIKDWGFSLYIIEKCNDFIDICWINRLTLFYFFFFFFFFFMTVEELNITYIFSSSVGMSIEWLAGVSQAVGSRPGVFSCELKFHLRLWCIHCVRTILSPGCAIPPLIFHYQCVCSCVCIWCWLLCRCACKLERVLWKLRFQWSQYF